MTTISNLKLVYKFSHKNKDQKDKSKDQIMTPRSQINTLAY